MILAVAGGKGGVGKSTVAYNLGAALDAVVVDADLGMADLPASRGPDLHDVLAGRAAILEAVRTDGPVALVPCGRSLRGARGADVRTLAGALSELSTRFDRVVVDCPAGMSADVGLPLHVADAGLLVTTPAPTALSDAIRTRAVARALDCGLVGAALNRATPAVDVAEIERALGLPVHPIPDSERLAAAQRAGRPLRSVDPTAPAAGAIDRLAAAVREGT